MSSTTVKTKVPITLMFEGNHNDNNYSVYIPQLRLGTVGDTLDEARENAIDLAVMKKERLLKVCRDNDPIIEHIELEL